VLQQPQRCCWQDGAVADASDWTVVIPVKELAAAKTRLADIPGLGPSSRIAIALAFACDTVAAARACPIVQSVLVVTADDTVAAAVRALGAEVIVEVGVGLNAAVNLGAETAGRAGAVRIAALVGDLPALRPQDLTAALQAGPAAGRFHVSDDANVGTTLLAAVGEPLNAHFGQDSNQRHIQSGSLQLSDVGASLRLDVDTRGDFRRACELGTGKYTSRLVAVALAGAAAPPSDAISITIRTTPDPADLGFMTGFLDDGTVVTLGPVTGQPWRAGQRLTAVPNPGGDPDFLIQWPNNAQWPDSTWEPGH